MDGFEEISGTQALRELFGYFFTAMPDYAAEITRVVIGRDLVVLEYVITATLAAPFPIGDETGTPTGTPMRFEAVDLLRHADGVFTRKDTYVDGFAMRKGLGL
ncbi:nuclear transport factor 2 family protein [Pseudonocardia sp. NPDC049635]|uniref:nuclear transport factor 2 family protein n=1 Tax=Pseudonocardia sp. NPDC049635 TaxID=3155506 RepID=UPI0033E125A4